MAKRNFLLDDEWKDLFCDLPDEKAGQLIKAAFCHHTGTDFSIDDPVLAAVFTLIRGRIDENDKKYDEACEKNRANVSKRYTGKNEELPKPTTVNDRIPEATTHVRGATKSTDSDSDSDSDVKEKSTLTSAKKEKHTHGEYKHVRLTDDELRKLAEEYGQQRTEDAITFLDEYIEEKGTKYKSHYLAMRRWVFDALRERKRPAALKTGVGRFGNFQPRSHSERVEQLNALRAAGMI